MCKVKKENGDIILLFIYLIVKQNDEKLMNSKYFLRRLARFGKLAD